MAGDSSQFRSLLQDKDLVDELRLRAAAGKLPLARQLGVAPELIERALERRPFVRPGLERGRAEGPAPGPQNPTVVEAIVLEQGRPSLIIQNGTFVPPETEIWRETLRRSADRIEQAIARVGRIELRNHLSYDWVGTGWLVAENIIVTNRHVAAEFAVKSADGIAFARNVVGTAIEPRIDFREEYEIDMAVEVRIKRCLYLADEAQADIALLEIEADTPLPEPIALAGGALSERQVIGVIGYPAYDSRNGPAAMRRYFGEVFDVKRFAPGKVSFPEPEQHYFVHDCTTLGGNSGSKVIDLETGHVVGLHFSGVFLSGNFAVKTASIKQALAGLSSQVAVRRPEPAEPEALADGRHQPEFFTGRDGYQSDFLGAGFEVPLPGLGDWADDVAPVQGASGDAAHVLAYRHFSVVLSGSRRLPLLTAVNINGEEARQVFRSEQWFVDLRVDEALQLGNEIYKRNELDRGHMVRRLDPVWGTKKEAAEANDDTFHYVNAAPQHRDLNQKEWNDLEDYILDSAKAKDLKVSVFTGPVLRETDQDYRGLVQLPQEFWKIAVLVDADSEELSASGYILSQGTMLRDITEAAFIFGEFRTYQVAIAKIAEATGLDFGILTAHDALTRPAGRDEVMLPRARMITGSRDLVL